MIINLTNSILKNTKQMDSKETNTSIKDKTYSNIIKSNKFSKFSIKKNNLTLTKSSNKETMITSIPTKSNETVTKNLIFSNMYNFKYDCDHDQTKRTESSLHKEIKAKSIIVDEKHKRRNKITSLNPKFQFNLIFDKLIYLNDHFNSHNSQVKNLFENRKNYYSPLKNYEKSITKLDLLEKLKNTITEKNNYLNTILDEHSKQDDDIIKIVKRYKKSLELLKFEENLKTRGNILSTSESKSKNFYCEITNIIKK